MRDFHRHPQPGLDYPVVAVSKADTPVSRLILGQDSAVLSRLFPQAGDTADPDALVGPVTAPHALRRVGHS